MYCKALSATPFGIDAVLVEVEADIGGGLPSFTTVGLAEASVREAKVRVQTAVENTGYAFPAGAVNINLAPAHVRKDGTSLDLALALAILAADGIIPKEALEKTVILGELSLSGELRAVRGVLGAVEAAHHAGATRALVPPQNGAEAALVSKVTVHTPHNLETAIAFLRTQDETHAPRAVPAPRRSDAAEGPDLVDVRGQSFARRALEIAAAGGHNLLFIGPPGGGKTMLARRLPSILPPLSEHEAFEVTRVQSAAGLNVGGSLVTTRPFRAPHHSTTPAGLVGGGAGIPRAGELSMAHAGVLFLDELPEFSRQTLEALRQPLESDEVVLSRAAATVRYPARVMLVAAMNPCPCGENDNPQRRCRCSTHQIAQYWSRLSAPLLDRIDLHVSVPPVARRDLMSSRAGEPSGAVRQRVVAARRRMRARGAVNARLVGAALRRDARLAAAPERLLLRAVEQLRLSARGYDRAIRVARTIADLAGAEAIDARHVAEALQYRGASAAVRAVA